MRRASFIIALCLIFSASVLYASVDVPDCGSNLSLDFLLERAVARNLIAGGVVVIGNHEGILASTARGRLTDAPDAPLLDERTVFDLASLTKVIATAPAVMKLLDEGRITLQDPLGLWFPEFQGSDHERTTVLHLLTHTSGLTDFDTGTEEPLQTASAGPRRSMGGRARAPSSTMPTSTSFSWESWSIGRRARPWMPFAATSSSPPSMLPTPPFSPQRPPRTGLPRPWGTPAALSRITMRAVSAG